MAGLYRLSSLDPAVQAMNTEAAEPSPADETAGDETWTEGAEVAARPAEISTLDDTWLQYTNY